MAFQIAPLQLPDPIRQPQLDFRPLQEIGQAIGDYRQQQREAQAIGQGLDLVTGQPAVTPAPAAPVPPRLADSGPVAQKIAAAAAKYGVPPHELMHIASIESDFNQGAVSPKGASGVMQLMPATARELGANPADLDQNIDAGARYYAQLRAKYGDPNLAAAAYNAGPGRVDAVLNGRAQLPDETKQYVSRFAAGAQQPAAPMPAQEPGLSPEFKQRLQTMLAAGGAARALAMGLIQKYLAPKYSPITLPDGTVGRFDPNTGTFTPTFQSAKTVDVKTPGQYGDTVTTTMQQAPNGTLTYPQIQGQGTGAAPQGGLPTLPDLHGEELLRILDPGEAAKIKGIAEGRIPYPSGFIMKTPYGRWLTDAVGQYEPGVDANVIAQRRKLQTDLASSSPTSIGGILSNGKSAFSHLADYSDSAVKLRNYNGPDIPGGAYIGEVGNVIGNSVLPTAETKGRLKAASESALRYGQEATKFYAGSGGGEAERLNALTQNNPTKATGAEMAGFLGTEKRLMLDRLAQKEQQIRDVMGKPYLDAHPVMTPDLQKTLDRIDANIARLNGQEPPVSPTAASTKTQATPATPTFESGRDAYAALKAGKLKRGDQFIVNGETRVVK